MLQFSWSFKSIPAVIAGVALLGFSPMALADGTQSLGTPVGITIESGTGIVMEGTGLALGQPQDINVSVPAGSTVTQVLLYWGLRSTSGDTDDTATVNGTEVFGDLIGGPTINETTYRADITSLGAVSAGANVLSIGGVDAAVFEPVWGAAVLVIFDDDSDLAEIDIRDGADSAYINAAGNEMTTVPVTFTFASAPDTRTGTLSLFFTGVAGTNSGGNFRPTAISVTINGSAQVFDNLLDSHDGEEADVLNLDVTIPGGTTMLTVQALSVDNLDIGGAPASFMWQTAGLSVPPPDVDEPKLCWITGGGFLNLDTDGTSGSKSFSFGGNVGPPPRGSWNVVDHDTGDKFHTNEVHMVSCETIDATGPGQPGGKKGLILNKANFAGTGTLNGIGGCPFTGFIVDGGEPQGKNGHDNDQFHIETTDAGICGGTFYVDGEMPGGNFQVHPPTGKP